MNDSYICVQNIANFLFYIYNRGNSTEWAYVLWHSLINKGNVYVSHGCYGRVRFGKKNSLLKIKIVNPFKSQWSLYVPPA